MSFPLNLPGLTSSLSAGFNPSGFPTASVNPLLSQYTGASNPLFPMTGAAASPRLLLLHWMKFFSLR